MKGLQVAPAELEGHLLMHPSVADAAVIGTPDEYAGELPLAFVVLQPAASAVVERDQKYADELRSSIFKVCNEAFFDLFIIVNETGFGSMSLTQSPSTSGFREALSLPTSFLATRVVKFYVVF